MTDDLLKFLRARLDDDERVANAATSWTWRPELANEFVSAEHIARWDPDRVLAEVDAKRRILEWLTPVDRTGMAGVLLRTLALPYASHTDFCAEWKLA